MLQIMRKLKPQHAAWRQAEQTLQLCAENRDSVIREQLKVTHAEGKYILNKVFNGGTPPDGLRGNAFMWKLQKTSLFCRWVAVSVLPAVFQNVLEDEDRLNPDASTLFFLWSACEDLILEAWLQKVQECKPRHVSLHFDGIRVDKACLADAEVSSFCSACSAHIKSATGFEVQIQCKTNPDLLEYVMQAGTAAVPADLDAALLADGNCIPCALHRLGFETQVMRFLADTETESALYFRRRGHRTYRQVAEALNIQLVASGYFIEDLKEGVREKNLLHVTKRGRPHTVGLLLRGGKFIVSDGRCTFEMKPEDFWDGLYSACDRASVVIFGILMGPASQEENPLRFPNASEREKLLDLQAGAGEQEHAAEFLDAVDEVSAHSDDCREESGSEQEESITKVGDNLLESLRREVGRVQRAKDTFKPSGDGRVHCPFCPFRSWEKKMRTVSRGIWKNIMQKDSSIAPVERNR